MSALLKLSAAIDAATTRIGVWVSWLILLAVVVSAGNAIVRKVFDVSSNAWLELQWQLFGAVFLLAASWTLVRNEHIRIDILNSRFPRAVRNWIELIGHLFFLMPLCLIMIWDGVPFFLSSVRINEQSGNAGGLPQWPSKLLIPLGFSLLAIQGVSEIIKRIAVMQGRIPDPHEAHEEAGVGHPAAEEAAV